jgi:hypothetical protein
MEFKPMLKGGRWAVGLILSMGLGLLINGCESDATAPDDAVPALSELQVARQAGRVAAGLAKVGPEILRFKGKNAGPAELGVYPFDFPEGGDITGSIVLEYFTGGAGGTHSTWGEADYGLLYTPGSSRLTVAVDLGGLDVEGFQLAFDLHGGINRLIDTARVSGSGSIVSGAWTTDFTIPESDPVNLSGISSYPSGGMLVFMVGDTELLVMYDGDDTAGVSIDEVLTYVIDLDTGIVQPAS